MRMNRMHCCKVTGSLLCLLALVFFFSNSLYGDASKVADSWRL